MFNAILVKGNMVGDVYVLWSGCGKLATASAVVSDVIDEAKHVNVNMRTLWDHEKLALMPMDEVKSKFFVRVKRYKDERYKRAAKLFGKITAVDAGFDDEFGFVTEEITEAVYEQAAKKWRLSIRFVFDA